MIRQELNPETCRLDTKHTKKRCILRIMEVLVNDHHALNRHHKEQNKITRIVVVGDENGEVVTTTKFGDESANMYDRPQ